MKSHKNKWTSLLLIYRNNNNDKTNYKNTPIYGWFKTFKAYRTLKIKN